MNGDDEMIRKLREMKALTREQEARFKKLRLVSSSPEQLSSCLREAGIDMALVLEASERISGKEPFVVASRDRYSGSTILKYVGAGLVAVAGAAGAYFGVRSVFFDKPSEENTRSAIYRGVDEKNWATPENRERHIKNLEGFLTTMKECERDKDSEGVEKCRELIGNYIDTVQKRDPDFAAKDSKFNSFRTYTGGSK